MLSPLPPSAIPGLTLKAWAFITWAAGVPTLRKSMNVSGIAAISVGIVEITFKTAMAGANYSFDAVIDGGSVSFYPGLAVRTAATVRGATYQSVNGTAADPVSAYFAIYE